jgi:nucleoside-diphosphate-sugar epimerase
MLRMHTVVTGANGFVGAATVAALRCISGVVVPVVRSAGPEGSIAVGPIGPETDWSKALRGAEYVIHTAARVHVMDGGGPSADEQYRVVNVLGTKRLAEQAAAAGVRRFVFVSSVKVNGERTQPKAPFRADGAPAPEDAYGRSKYEAEQALQAIATATGLEVVVVRAPLVYGPGVGANFGQLVRAVRRGMPLPFAGIDNRRSLVGLDNLVDLLLVCAQRSAAAGHTFMVSDGHDLSTPQLIRCLARAMDRAPRLFMVPAGLLRIGGRLAGRSRALERLTGSLQVDIQLTTQVLGWAPRVSVEAGLARTVAGPDAI